MYIDLIKIRYLVLAEKEGYDKLVSYARKCKKCDNVFIYAHANGYSSKKDNRLNKNELCNTCQIFKAVRKVTFNDVCEYDFI